MTSRLVFDTSVYIAILRDGRFAAAFRDRFRTGAADNHSDSSRVEEDRHGPDDPLDANPAARGQVVRGLINDALIALTARSIGAMVVTRDGTDFRLVQRVRPFELEIV